MIKLRFSPLSNQNSSYKNEFYTDKDEYLVPAEKDIIPISVDFNNQTYVVQTISYDAYTCNFYLRDDLYRSIQNIQSSHKINIWEIGDDARITGDQFELIEINSEPFGQEFWKVNLKLRHLPSKLIENVIDNITDDTLTINTTEYNVPFAPITNSDKETTLATDVDSKTPDFSKVSDYYELRLYLTGSELQTFYNLLANVSSYSSAYKITYKSIQFSDYEDTKEQIGNDLFEISLKLYSNIDIIVPATS